MDTFFVMKQKKSQMQKLHLRRIESAIPLNLAKSPLISYTDIYAAR